MTTTMTHHDDPTTAMTESTATSGESGTPVTREEGRYLSPPVDIYETDDALVVVADLPGVGRDDIGLRVENGVLSIEGRPSYGRPSDTIHAEFDLAPYYREFRLSDKVDSERITAELKHGVLRVRLPKAARVRPRSIDVSVS